MDENKFGLCWRSEPFDGEWSYLCQRLDRIEEGVKESQRVTTRLASVSIISSWICVFCVAYAVYTFATCFF